jgi:hypothetical protein
MIKEKQLIQTEDDDLLRDVYSKGLINKNFYGLNQYKTQKKLIEQKKEVEEETKMRLAKLEEDMNEIKVLLMEIAQLRGKQCQ